MRVVAEAVLFLAQLAQVVLGVAVQVANEVQHLRQAQPTWVVAAAVMVKMMLGAQVRLAAQASLSFHTQAQHNYSVVALLPNQAVTSFTHLHLLAHLALWHL